MQEPATTPQRQLANHLVQATVLLALIGDSDGDVASLAVRAQRAAATTASSPQERLDALCGMLALQIIAAPTVALNSPRRPSISLTARNALRSAGPTVTGAMIDYMHTLRGGLDAHVERVGLTADAPPAFYAASACERVLETLEGVPFPLKPSAAWSLSLPDSMCGFEADVLVGPIGTRLAAGQELSLASDFTGGDVTLRAELLGASREAYRGLTRNPDKRTAAFALDGVIHASVRLDDASAARAAARDLAKIPGLPGYIKASCARGLQILADSAGAVGLTGRAALASELASQISGRGVS